MAKQWYAGLLSLFQSRKFWLAVVGVVQTIVFHYWPEMPQELWQAINTILMVLIGAIAVEDAAKRLSVR
jgi:uncharacterized membrane protein HdeD (DUF308 family)